MNLRSNHVSVFFNQFSGGFTFTWFWEIALKGYRGLCIVFLCEPNQERWYLRYLHQASCILFVCFLISFPLSFIVSFLTPTYECFISHGLTWGTKVDKITWTLFSPQLFHDSGLVHCAIILSVPILFPPYIINENCTSTRWHAKLTFDPSKKCVLLYARMRLWTLLPSSMWHYFLGVMAIRNLAECGHLAIFTQW